MERCPKCGRMTWSYCYDRHSMQCCAYECSHEVPMYASREESLKAQTARAEAAEKELAEAEQLVRLGAVALWDASLNGTPFGMGLHKWLSTPEPGDLVIEISTSEAWPGRGQVTCVDRMGRLVSVRDVAFPRDPECPEEDLGSRQVWYIERRDGRLISWENCRFIKVIEQDGETWPWGDERTRPDRSAWLDAALQRHADELSKAVRPWCEDAARDAAVKAEEEG